jgi:hypothetical protein
MSHLSHISHLSCLIYLSPFFSQVELRTALADHERALNAAHEAKLAQARVVKCSHHQHQSRAIIFAIIMYFDHTQCVFSTRAIIFRVEVSAILSYSGFKNLC